MYHPPNGSPRTANTWGYFAVHEKHEANRAATASHGELPRLHSREGRKKAETEKGKNSKGDQTLGYLGVVKPVTPEEDVPLSGQVPRLRLFRAGNYLPLLGSVVGGAVGTRITFKTLHGPFKETSLQWVIFCSSF
ncbi:hypothetical protein AVEN_254406-1 [Araneus ventricosus]|uniref:Uncharacterized protein n=1 Tax=Araneus ventricosus TaxID=182803 RepID=A0A4Y2IH36_ARAVE|nr:hypothetical protein AVEN_254406-1 [Araneus ventricosus]